MSETKTESKSEFNFSNPAFSACYDEYCSKLFELTMKYGEDMLQAGIKVAQSGQTDGFGGIL